MCSADHHLSAFAFVLTPNFRFSVLRFISSEGIGLSTLKCLGFFFFFFFFKVTYFNYNVLNRGSHVGLVIEPLGLGSARAWLVSLISQA